LLPANAYENGLIIYRRIHSLTIYLLTLLVHSRAIRYIVQN